MIIGITGTLGAGKGAVVEYLKEHYGFAHYSARDFIVAEIERRGLPVNRDSMLEVANSLRREYGPGHIAEKLYEKAQASDQNSVMESLRTMGEVENLKGKSKFCLFAIDADPKLRYERITARKSETDSVSFEKFLEDEKREMDSDDSTKQNLGKCIAAADYKFMNNGSLQELYAQVDLAIKDLLKNN